MATQINPDNLQQKECVIQDQLLIGPLLAPRNSARGAGAGSIHDDATAQKLGFRGGTVAGSLHMEQFPPLLTRLFGERWWQTGGMSLYFRYATQDLEPVRCFADIREELPEAESARTRIWMEDGEDHLVAEGTANIGGADTDSALRQRIAATPAVEDIRILKDVKPGHVSAPAPAAVDRESLQRRLDVITEPLDIYQQAQPVLPPSLLVNIMRAAEGDVLPRHKDMGVGLFGAIEVQHINGPVYAGRSYSCTTEVLKVGETPKTEYLWYHSILRDGDAEVASMLMMLRFMKASSALWQ